MASVNYLMLVAYELVMLTFSLGALIIALPVPLRGVKVWGGRLISDSVLAFILITLYWTLIQFSDSLPTLLGWTWGSFTDWYNHVLAIALGVKMMIAAIIASARLVYLSYLVYSLLWPLDKVVNMVILTFTTIGALMLIVRKTYMYLAALGIALYSLPLRIGKSAGAGLLAFALVFNAGLPLMPAFISSAMGMAPEIPESLGALIAKVRVYDATGYPVTAGFVRERIVDNGKSVEVARYLVGENGYLDGPYGLGYASMPSRAPSYWSLEIDGVIIPLYPYPLDPTTLNESLSGYNINLTTPFLLYQSGYRIVYTDTRTARASLEGGEVRVSAYLDSGQYVEADAPSGCRVDYTYEGPMSVEKGVWEWRGITGSYLRLVAGEPGYYNVTFKFEGSCRAKPQLPEPKDYIMDYLGLTKFSRTGAPRMLVGYVILPSIYLFVLSSIAFALARLLGGRERLIPRL
ncbi:MAG: hypothetical protein GSR80_000486 [Desulfurococcales archaeon]|nr:hypothetical protein [Desulfurococcales archaeon]